MPSIHLEDLSAFGRLAVKLDGDFSALTRLSGQIQRLDIDSESGLERAVKLLDQFAQHGTSIAEGILDFSKSLQEARAQSEEAAKLVAERAQLIGRQKQRQNETREELNRLERDVQAANASLGGFRKEGKNEFSQEEKRQIKAELERLSVDLKRFLAEAQVIKDAAGRSKFKSIERDAQNLIDALRTSCRKLDKAPLGHFPSA